MEIKGAREEIARLQRASELLSDLTWLYNQVSHLWWIDHLKEQLQTQGAHGGDPWDFAGEERYAAFKRAAVGHDDVFRWEAGREQIVPSLTDPDDPFHEWSVGPMGYSIASGAPNADVFEGGIGPFGEPFPPRDPFRTTEDQLQQLEELEQLAINQALRDIGLTVTDT